MKVRECMCDTVCTCKPETTISEVAKMMSEHHIGCVPVCDHGESIVGILTDRDIILRAIACGKEASNTKVSDIMTTDTTCCREDDEITTVSNLMAKEQVRRIPVTENGKLVGILTLGDFAKNQQINHEFVGKTSECICGYNDKNAE